MQLKRECGGAGGGVATPHFCPISFIKMITRYLPFLHIIKRLRARSQQSTCPPTPFSWMTRRVDWKFFFLSLLLYVNDASFKTFVVHFFGKQPNTQRTATAPLVQFCNFQSLYIYFLFMKLHYIYTSAGMHHVAYPCLFLYTKMK